MDEKDFQEAVEEYKTQFTDEPPNTESEFTDVWNEEICMLTHLPRIFEREKCIPEKYYLKTISNWKRIGSWESQISDNDVFKVRDRTGRAFSKRPTKDDEVVTNQMKALTKLHGVGPAIASTILMFRAPDVYPVMDWRALEALTDLGRWDGPTEADVDRFTAYQKECHELAEEFDTSLRDVDRALWIRGEED